MNKLIFTWSFFLQLIWQLTVVFPAKSQEKSDFFYPGAVWPDEKGIHINAHGGSILFHEGKYYRFGEYKAEKSNHALVGVTCYSSDDLYNWKNESIALPVIKNDTLSDIQEGCIIERPKVIYNEKTRKFVLYFHLELKGKGYEAARVGIAVADSVTGTYRYQKSYRPNAGCWPIDMTAEQQQSPLKPADFSEWWTPDWRKAVEDGMFVRRDWEGGQMSRDMTLFVDDDGKAYHVYASEENLTLHIAELSDNYLSHTGKYARIAPGGHNEAPAIFKKDGRYFMITSGCTGWAPNAARLFTADSIWGPWTQHSNPCVGDDADLTFHSQSTYILPVQGKKDAFIFMADRWTPKHPIDGRYIWLPILFENGWPVLKWFDKWDLSIFDPQALSSSKQYRLIWSDEFDHDGKPNPAFWNYENGFVRNEEQQWYQPDNANCRNGILTIEARKEHLSNLNYETNSRDWRKNRPFAEYTSACIKTNGKKEFLYGRFEVRAKIPTASGSWPAIWTLGKSMPWPSNGEIDIMEYYRIKNVPHILANTAWGTGQPNNAKWNSKTVPFSKFTDKDPDWANKFHIWRMDWDEEAIRLYLDDELLNETLLKDTQNGTIGNHTNPFMQPHYLLLNLAIGGQHGGSPDNAAFPLKYEIDYVRVYQRQTPEKQADNDRRYWTDLAYKIAAPVLSNMSKGELSKNMQVEVSPSWDGRNKRVTYMEAFGRLMDGIAPWLALPYDDTDEGKQRKQLREWALKSYAHAVNPESPDYLLWRTEGQPLVDAAFLASSLLRAPKQLWEPLDSLTKQRYVAEFQQLRRIDPPYSNWLLFSSTIETFLLSVNAQYDIYRIHSAIRKIEEWYVGDGWYSDGEHFAFDYYNSYVIQPMYVQVLKTLVDNNLLSQEKNKEVADKRMQRFGMILERMISPEGTFPVFGRSMTYRLGVFQPLALLAWNENLPKELSEGQVRSALTCVMKRMFAAEENFNEEGFLSLGFAGRQPNLADWYTNNGSLYLTSEIFLPLGLPANHSFWSSPAQEWTAKKAWNGKDFPKDHAIR
jgi:hypothetical protein